MNTSIEYESFTDGYHMLKLKEGANIYRLKISESECVMEIMFGQFQYDMDLHIESPEFHKYLYKWITDTFIFG